MGRLFHFREIICRHAVEFHHAHFHQRIVFVRPDLGEVKRVDFVTRGFGLRHDLDADFPLGEVARGNGVSEIALGEVRVFAHHFDGVFAVKVLDALHGLEVPFAIDHFVLRIDQAEGVAGESIHVAMAVRCTS